MAHRCRGITQLTQAPDRIQESLAPTILLFPIRILHFLEVDWRALRLGFSYMRIPEDRCHRKLVSDPWKSCKVCGDSIQSQQSGAFPFPFSEDLGLKHEMESSFYEIDSSGIIRVRLGNMETLPIPRYRFSTLLSLS